MTGPVAIIGFGRFGRALADLLLEADVMVRAWDPMAEIPAPLAAGSRAEAIAGADTVVVATPIPTIRQALTDLRPELSPDQLVIDVASVKQQPIEAMREVLGGDIPWAATHPLFGPTNITRGERDLRAVVCPNPMHPGSSDRARALYERIGCTVIEQTGEDHDRVMARTHAMAFFIAKGLVDIGAGDDLPFAPPSFQALASTIDSVRSDAGHLFLAIERDNPYAADARQALIDAMARVHAELDIVAPEDTGADHEGILTIPDLGSQAPELMETRDLIDELDRDLVRMLARRARLAARAGEIKAEHGRGIRDPEREQELLDERRGWADEHDLHASAIVDVFTAILRMSREVQSD